MVWTGWDGSEWELTKPSSGVFITGKGVEGLGMPEHQAWVGESPAVHGQFYRGYVVEPRQVFWPIYLYSDESTEAWMDRDRAFWRSLRPGMHGSWSVTTPRGGKRSLACRFVDDGNHAFQYDPMLRGWASYGVSLIADNPFWTGEPVRRIWSDGPASDFYAQRMPLTIRSASTLGSAAMTNEGDLEAWPVWTIRGPLTSVTVGVEGATVQWDVTLDADDVLVIDTDPTVQSAWLNGVDVTDQLGTADFAPIPAGDELPLSLAMAGTGSVEATITPRFFRAW
ncbi:minor tail protein [Arthrobacter phage Bauer]|uniref:Minor tail protein n=1 Tax=Arthrobacter phage Bauer TaxID=2985648 RepID=A0A9E8ADB5_9CAUD|nr:minor tail protein [Arthrobacter phage Bauer]UYM26569.1 minor tail protein [Arthrobacter phage Bauer]